VRALLVGAGSIFLGLGILGVFLPLLPTTPFLLLSAACFVRGSSRLHDWLLSNPRLGPYIRDYQEGKGIPRRSKIVSVALLWATVVYSILFVLSHLALRVVLFSVAVGVTAHLLKMKTRE
jgi:uncharacterized membrane protein YbaN (DUF454 family)